MKRNSINKRWVIPDIHGDFRKLMRVIEKSGIDYENDLLISLGDVCDRGPQTQQVVDELMKFKNLIKIRGNHDWWFLQYLTNPEFLNTKNYQTWLSNGGKQTLESYNNNISSLRSHIDFFKTQIPYYISPDNLLFIHAGFNPEELIEGQDESILMWDRSFIRSVIEKGENILSIQGFKEIFVGHTPTWYYNKGFYPIIIGNVYLLDTGCGKEFKSDNLEIEGELIILNVDTKEYFHSND